MKKTLFYLAIASLSFLGCSKNEDNLPSSISNLPVKIVLISNYATVSSTSTLYEFEYNDKREVKTIKYNNADSVYSSISYDANGRLTKMGTAKNPNAIKVEYNADGGVSKVTESTRGVKGLEENYRTYDYSNSQLTKTNYYNSANTLLRSITYTTDPKGNLTTAIYAQGQATSGNTATLTYDDKANPLYNIKVNPALAFLPQGLWTNIEFILFSKNLINQFAYTGDGTRQYSYEFDVKNRISKIFIGVKSTTGYQQTYEITYLD
ncbi:MAG: hypothetical protein ABIP95_04365 [Pelobium sp.]